MTIRSLFADFRVASAALLLLYGLASASEKPNVVFILVDDLGWMDLGCQGSSCYQTPHIDRLAAAGVRFTDAYASCPVCSPTRHLYISASTSASGKISRPGIPKRPRNSSTCYIAGERTLEPRCLNSMRISPEIDQKAARKAPRMDAVPICGDLSF